jgi:hypothetical protein
MEIHPDFFRILGILCYLNYPKYLKKTNINCVEDIFEQIENKIEEIAIQIDELENNYTKMKNEKDKILILKQIDSKKIEIIDLKNQLNFIKN